MFIPLVTIIIPTYNRAHLIGETLDSIIAQTYTNWECIVVDDGSTDTTDVLLNRYKNKDARFKYFVRSITQPKGANVCRNIGLDKAKGDYIVFFDSDDLMTIDHLKVKISGMLEFQTDFVITKTKFIDDVKKIGKNNYRFQLYPITAFNYVSQANNWLTYDVCIKREIAQGIRFNELLQSGQEYNYFSKLVHVTVNAKFIDKTVTLRRFHGNTIRSGLNTKEKLMESSFRAKWFTYRDLLGIANKKTRLMLLDKCILLVYDTRRILIKDKIGFINAVFKEYHWRGFYFLLMLLNLKIVGSGYFFYKKLTFVKL